MGPAIVTVLGESGAVVVVTTSVVVTRSVVVANSVVVTRSVVVADSVVVTRSEVAANSVGAVGDSAVVDVESSVVPDDSVSLEVSPSRLVVWSKSSPANDWISVDGD